jgi:hypothetical protein
MIDLRDFRSKYSELGTAAKAYCSMSLTPLAIKCLQEARRRFRKTATRTALMARPLRKTTEHTRLKTEEDLTREFEFLRHYYDEQFGRVTIACGNCSVNASCSRSDKDMLEPRRKMVQHVWEKHGQLEVGVGTRYLASDELRKEYYKRGAATNNEEAIKRGIPLKVTWINDEVKYGVKATRKINSTDWINLGYRGYLINKSLMEARSKEEDDLVEAGRITKGWRCDVYFMQLSEDYYVDGSDPFTNLIAWAVNSAISPKTCNAEFSWDPSRMNTVT